MHYYYIEYFFIITCHIHIHCHINCHAYEYTQRYYFLSLCIRMHGDNYYLNFRHLYSACTCSTYTCTKTMTSICSYIMQTIHQQKIKPTLNTLINLLSLDSFDLWPFLFSAQQSFHTNPIHFLPISQQ